MPGPWKCKLNTDDNSKNNDKIGNRSSTFVAINKVLRPITIVNVQICDFVSDHALVKCTIAFPRQMAHTPNIVQYRRYHRINMSDFCSDLKNTSFVKSPADAVVDLYEQYVYDLGNVLD